MSGRQSRTGHFPGLYFSGLLRLWLNPQHNCNFRTSTGIQGGGEKTKPTSSFSTRKLGLEEQYTILAAQPKPSWDGSSAYARVNSNARQGLERWGSSGKSRRAPAPSGIPVRPAGRRAPSPTPLLLAGRRVPGWGEETHKARSLARRAVRMPAQQHPADRRQGHFPAARARSVPGAGGGSLPRNAPPSPALPRPRPSPGGAG